MNQLPIWYSFMPESQTAKWHPGILLMKSSNSELLVSSSQIIRHAGSRYTNFQVGPGDLLERHEVPLPFQAPPLNLLEFLVLELATFLEIQVRLELWCEEKVYLSLPPHIHNPTGERHSYLFK